MNVPFVDLRAQHEEIRAELEAAFSQALDRSAFIGGPAVASFELAFAELCGTTHAVALASGTDALELALRACGVGRGDLIVTTPHTFIGTVEGAVQLGAEPRFVDIDPATYNVDPAQVRAYLEGSCERDADGVLRERGSNLRVAAIIPVHLYGLVAPMAEILAIGQQFGVDVIEDAAQAQGARYRLPDGRWVRAGQLGRVGCFSFYPSKNLGALGEAGAIVTSDEQVAADVGMLRDHGQAERYIHQSSKGVNGRMDALQASFLTIKLARLDAWNERRRRVAGWYAEELGDSGLQLPAEPAESRHIYHLYVVRVPERERVRAYLDQHGIATGLHYPIPLHLQPGFADLDLGPGLFPHTEQAAEQIVSLPMFPHLSREQVAYVAARLREAVREAIGQ
jgi:dTDP-4-amino-4,6-dideoxygalactose transaminase